MGRILVIDDESSVRRFFCEVLKEAGHQSIEASTAREAFACLREQPIDLVITDILMPDIDGLEVTRTLHRDYPSLKIIAISGGRQDFDYGAVARLLGADETLMKPVTVHRLQEAVAKLLGSS